MEFIDLNMIQLLGVVVLVFCGGYYVGTRNIEIKWLHRQISKLEFQTQSVTKATPTAIKMDFNTPHEDYIAPVITQTN